ncbi:MAG: hypothetical protein ACLPV8_25190 [Steroidobacteraceae bacterium]
MAYERGPFSTAIFVGELFKTGLPNFVVTPWNTDLSPSYLVAVDFDYRVYKFPTIPLQFEAEFDVGKRFRGANQWDIATAPVARWMYFPWNKWLYTNFRLGMFGFSYATGISAWEQENSGNNKGARLLQFLVGEVTFAAGENSRSEAFIGVHHRSGDYGLFDGVSGASNYLGCGFRVFW